MVSGDFVVKNEVMNDGGSIHIYFAKKYNEFVAFGISAFQAMKTLKAKEIELIQDYSTEFQMPMVIIRGTPGQVRVSRSDRARDYGSTDSRSEGFTESRIYGLMEGQV